MKDHEDLVTYPSSMLPGTVETFPAHDADTHAHIFARMHTCIHRCMLAGILQHTYMHTDAYACNTEYSQLTYIHAYIPRGSHETLFDYDLLRAWRLVYTTQKGTTFEPSGAYIHTDRQTHRQTDRHTYMHT